MEWSAAWTASVCRPQLHQPRHALSNGLLSPTVIPPAVQELASVAQSLARCLAIVRASKRTRADSLCCEPDPLDVCIDTALHKAQVIGVLPGASGWEASVLPFRQDSAAVASHSETDTASHESNLSNESTDRASDHDPMAKRLRLASVPSREPFPSATRDLARSLQPSESAVVYSFASECLGPSCRPMAFPPAYPPLAYPANGSCFDARLPAPFLQTSAVSSSHPQVATPPSKDCATPDSAALPRSGWTAKPTAQDEGWVKGRMTQTEKERVDMFVRAVEDGSLRIRKGDLARELREYVNPDRPREFFEKLVSRRQLNQRFSEVLGPKASRRQKREADTAVTTLSLAAEVMSRQCQ